MTNISHSYLQLAEVIAEHVNLPVIRQIYIPGMTDEPGCTHKFGAVILDDGSVGVMYILMDETLPQLQQYVGSLQCQGANPMLLARSFTGADPAKKSLALGTLNAISQFILKNSGYHLDYTTDSLALFHPQPSDAMGMVGYFPPLVKHIREANVPLTVIELKEDLVRQEPGFLVTLDTSALRRCTKVLCTSTVLLNDSLDDILQHCQEAERVAIIGPTAGFLPDPLFERGVNTIGGTVIHDAELFLQLCQKGDKWGMAAKKYCIQRNQYPGFKKLLSGFESP
jgi:uncharacterized protein (DUF4213/DUF364 family)